MYDAADEICRKERTKPVAILPPLTLFFALPLKFVRFSAQIILIHALKSTKQCIRVARCRLYCIRPQGVIFAPLLSTDATRRASRVEIPGQAGRFCSTFLSGKTIKGRVLLTGRKRTEGPLLVFRNEVDRWGPARRTAQRPSGFSFLPPKLPRFLRKNSYLQGAHHSGSTPDVLFSHHSSRPMRLDARVASNFQGTCGPFIAPRLVKIRKGAGSGNGAKASKSRKRPGWKRRSSWFSA